MNKLKIKSRWLTGQEADTFLGKLIRFFGIALIIILGMLIASGILFNAAVVQLLAP